MKLINNTIVSKNVNLRTTKMHLRRPTFSKIILKNNPLCKRRTKNKFIKKYFLF